MTDTERKRDAPVLIAVDDVSVTQWVKLYEAYVKRGGTRRPRDCIDADVLSTLGLLDIEVASSGEDLAADDGRFLNELRALHAAPDEDSARAALSAISLTGGFTVDAVCSFVQHAKAVAKLGEGVVLDIFLDGVEPKLIRKRLKGGSPATWKAAAQDLVRRVREHEAKAKEVELLERAVRAEKKTNAKVKASVPVGGAELPTQLNSTPTSDETSGRRGAQPGEVAAGGNDGARDEEKAREANPQALVVWPDGASLSGLHHDRAGGPRPTPSQGRYYPGNPLDL